MMAVPKYDEMFNALLGAIHALGGSASREELENKVSEILRLSEADLSVMHKPSVSKFNYNLAWTLSYAKKYGLLENLARKIWSLTEKGKQTKSIDPLEIKRVVRALYLPKKQQLKQEDNNFIELNSDNELEDILWETEALEAIKAMPPEAFERLCQLLLRRSGFVQVEVTGRTGDGGIDGKGILKFGILSFHVFFQCKRYKDTVGSPVVRDFRGAMIGRADKGIIITTGTFSRDAKLEALRDGATPLDLIDGDELVRMLKEHSIGIKTEQKMIEVVQVNKNYFLEF
jgi:restriction system protein